MQISKYHLLYSLKKIENLAAIFLYW